MSDDLDLHEWKDLNNKGLIPDSEDDWTSDQYAHAIKSWGLNDTQMNVLKMMMDDIYVDGWGDGAAHRTNLTPDEFRERITDDIKNSWMRLVIEGVDK